MIERLQKARRLSAKLTGNRGFLGTSGAAYASALAVDFEGIREYVQLTATTLVGVAASDGKLLWRYDRPSNTHRINCTTPIYHDGIVYVSTCSRLDKMESVA